MVLLRRLITIGSVSILSTCVTATCAGNEWNFGPRLSPNGLVRFGRAAVAVGELKSHTFISFNIYIYIYIDI